MRVRALIGLILGFAVLSVSVMSSRVHAENEIIPIGENFGVFVTPPFGKYPKPLLVTMTPAEVRVINRSQQEVDPISVVKPVTTRLVTWYVEPSAANSPTLRLARRSLVATQAIFEALGIYEAQATSIVVGRTQKFLKKTVKALGCDPDLSITGGQHLMGSSLCEDSVIVMNLTGYLFLVNSTQKLTAALEMKPEPPIASMDYRIVDRNISALSHEWAHSVRGLLSGGRVAFGEPAWMREGFAELVAGFSRVKAFPLRMQYSDFHAIKIHLFSNWQNQCQGSLRDYAVRLGVLAGCEYHNGLMAVELLLSEFGGLRKLLKLYKDTSVLRGFEASFLTNYGMTLPEFELLANKFIDDIAEIPFRA
jgi:hypothetical protein